MNNIPHLFDHFDPSFDREMMGSRFAGNTLCVFYGTDDDVYEIAVERCFQIINEGKVITLADMKKIND